LITFATLDDVDAIMSFIDKEWKRNHILARDKSFFGWMYVRDKTVNFVVSKKNGYIDGILGFVAYDENNSQVALTVWKALKSKDGLIGMSMLRYLEKELQPRIIATPGINFLTTAALYKYFKYQVGKMDHYYRLAKKDVYHIAIVNDSVVWRDVCGVHDIAFNQIYTYEEYANYNVILEKNAIQKDAWYIRRRYFEHPYFEYLHFMVEKDGNVLDIVMREQFVNGYKCIRIVDLLGKFELLEYVGTELDNLLAERDYEYIDCYVGGIREAIFDRSGWLNVEETNDIVPNYFEPYEQKNIELYYSAKPYGVVVLRGDGDQDRPN